MNVYHTNLRNRNLNPGQQGSSKAFVYLTFGVLPGITFTQEKNQYF